MKIKNFVQSILRSRVLRLQKFNTAYNMPQGQSRNYLVLGADADILSFTNFVRSTEPVEHHIFLL